MEEICGGNIPEKTKETLSDALSAIQSFGEKTTEVIKNAAASYTKQLEGSDKKTEFIRNASKYLSTGAPPVQPTAANGAAEKAPTPDASGKISVTSLTDAYNSAKNGLKSYTDLSKLYEDSGDIRKRIESAIIKRADADSKAPYKGLFDGIDDKLIEKCLPIADEVIKSNKSKGLLPEDAEEKYPYMRDALALFYASSETGNKNAAKKAREVAYTDVDSKPKHIVESITDEPQITTVSHENKPEKNNGSIFFDNTKIINKKYQRVYHGDIWDGAEQQDLSFGKMTSSEIRQLPHLSYLDINVSETEHRQQMMLLAKLTSNGEMQAVALDMVEHFFDGTGTDYSNYILTKTVSNHPETQRFMQDVTKAFKHCLLTTKGNISEIIDNEILKKRLKDTGVLLSKYSYNYDDLFTGLMFSIHGWTETNVNITSYKLNEDGTYYGNLQFVFIDNFGLNPPDIIKYGNFKPFRSWFVLQHYKKYQNKYKPFRTYVTLNYPFSGRIY